ncbi:ABC transporter ATP-binding protein [Candidatus Saccharibacteria bacterium]|nr:ABC transporter ATP-binding protein [Candidatus Saccharibacteria bacterium]
MKKEKKGEKRKLTRRTLHYYWQATKKHKGLFVTGILVTPIVVASRTVMVPYFTADIIGKVSAGIDPVAEWSAFMPSIIGLLACYLIGSELLGHIRIWAVWKLELKVAYDLATYCFDRVCTQSMRFHSNRFSGSLVSQTNKFVGGYERLFDTLIFSVLWLGISVVASVAILAVRAPLFAIILVAVVLLYTTVATLSYKKVGKLSAKYASAETKQTGQLADSMSNILAVKSYGRESHEKRRYAGFSNATFDAGMNQMRAVIVRDVWFGLVLIACVVASTMFETFGTKFGMDVATLILIAQYTSMILGNLWDVNNILKSMNRVFGDAHDMTEILDTKDAVKDKAKAKDIQVKKGAIKFNAIRFQHADAPHPIFDDFSLDVKAGERIGLVGLSGSGKTTLTKLLLRFADVSEGKIEVDGQDIKQVKQVSLRENIAYVPQDTALFHRSIAENIAYGKPDASIQEIKRAAELAHADEFIKDLPNGYDTLVGERGVKLSGGQRQRISIARAILKDAPILVLDEATSALDSESEALIQDALNRLMKGRTSIVVAHRLSTIAGMDKIVVLEDGKIMEQGSHEELLENKRGSYSRLWSRQSGAFLNKETDEVAQIEG